MKVRRALKGPFLRQPYFSESEIENICLDELGRQQLLPSEPAAIRIDRFIEKRFGKPHLYADLPKGILGFTRFGLNGVQDVVISQALEEDTSKPSERRLRSTLAHEAGHGLLHAHLFVLEQQRPLLGDWSDPNSPRVLCREPGQYSGDWWEYQANMLMGAILLPKPLVQKAMEPHLRREGMLGVAALPEEDRGVAIRALAEIFDVNPVFVRIRLEKLFSPRGSGQLSL